MRRRRLLGPALALAPTGSAYAQADTLASTHQIPDVPSSYPRPDEAVYNVAKAFAAIVRSNAEGNVDDLGYAIDLSKLRDHGLVWRGPSHVFTWARFYADYNPPKSSVGIAKIEIVWDAGRTVRLEGKPAISVSLNVTLQPGKCPSKDEMASAIRAAMRNRSMPGPDGGPPIQRDQFIVQDSRGRSTTIIVSPDLCYLSATFVREN